MQGKGPVGHVRGENLNGADFEKALVWILIAPLIRSICLQGRYSKGLAAEANAIC